MATTFKYPNGKQPEPLNVRVPAWIPATADIAAKYALDTDRMRVLLHQFFLCYLKNSKLRRSKAGSNFLPDYFPVSSFLLRQVCTDHYIKYVNALIAEGIIERLLTEHGTPSYLPDKRAQMFRWLIPENFYAGCSFRKESITGAKQIKAVLRTRDKHVKLCESGAFELSKDNPVYAELYACLNDVIIDESYQREIATGQTADLRFLECEALANKDFTWFKRDSFGHRLHHPVTTMPKEYRRHLRFKEHPQDRFAVLDIKNSQPYMSAIISKDLINGYLPEFRPILEHLGHYEQKPDFLLYRRLCVEGRLYEFLMEGMGYDTKKAQTSHKVRAHIKELFFASVLFSRTRVFGEKSRFRESFRMCFPTVHKMFQTIKQMDASILPGLKEIIRPKGKKYKYEKSSDSYKLVACLMQRIEAALVYQVIVPRLLAEGIKCICIHDSFIIRPQHVDRARQIITDSFEGLGLPVPSLSLE